MIACLTLVKMYVSGDFVDPEKRRKGEKYTAIYLPFLLSALCASLCCHNPPTMSHTHPKICVRRAAINLYLALPRRIPKCPQLTRGSPCPVALGIRCHGSLGILTRHRLRNQGLGHSP
jgi:hypothetical protein